MLTLLGLSALREQRPDSVAAVDSVATLQNKNNHSLETFSACCRGLIVYSMFVAKGSKPGILKHQWTIGTCILCVYIYICMYVCIYIYIYVYIYMYPQRLSFAKLRRCNVVVSHPPIKCWCNKRITNINSHHRQAVHSIGKINKGIMTRNSHPGLNCTDKYVIPSNPLHEILPSDWFSRTPMATSMISEWSRYSMHW